MYTDIELMFKAIMAAKSVYITLGSILIISTRLFMLPPAIYFHLIGSKLFFWHMLSSI